MPTPHSSPPLPEASLVIHAAADPAVRGTLFTAPLEWLHWMRSLYAPPLPPKPDGPLRLHIDNLQGQRVFTADDAGSLVELALPVGTYNVTAVLGTLCRGYTLTLVEGEPSDLYLCPSLCNGK
ncbi:hypothetical protein [Rhodoferax sp.]|uniref:hypothetical protein n=1 Tax=Rhodoferax sp. TaxID=50421 RepID=UPI0025D576D5|nr:hypothetical protein [Rhodoferax sp.]